MTHVFTPSLVFGASASRGGVTTLQTCYVVMLQTLNVFTPWLGLQRVPAKVASLPIFSLPPSAPRRSRRSCCRLGRFFLTISWSNSMATHFEHLPEHNEVHLLQFNLQMVLPGWDHPLPLSALSGSTGGSRRSS